MAPIQVESSVTIDAPPEAVWAFVSDPHRYPEWSVVTEEMLAVDNGRVGEGTTYQETGGLGPFTGSSDWVITSFEPPIRQVHEGDDGTVRTLLTIELESIDDGRATTLHQSVELDFPPGLRLLARVFGLLFLRRMAADALTETVENAKRIVETEHATVA